MPQGPIAVSTIPQATKLNVTAATVIKASAGHLRRVIILNAGTTSGSFTINDSATTAGAAAANQVWTVAFNGTGVVAGAIFTFDIPCFNGITVSAVPGGGTPILAIAYD